MNARSKAILLALFFGGVGLHKFYTNRVGQGLFYLFFFWTLIPTFLAIVDIIRYIIMSNEEFDKKYR